MKNISFGLDFDFFCPFSGLYRDDFYDYTDAVSNEAVRRLPADVYDKLVFRQIRASQLEITKRYLPEEERPTYEDVSFKYLFFVFFKIFLTNFLFNIFFSEQNEANGYFLQPYLDRVKREKKEKEEWVKFLSKD